MLTKKELSKSKWLLITFALVSGIFSNTLAQEKTFGNIRFQLTPITEPIFENNLKALENGSSIETDDLVKFMANIPILDPLLLKYSIPSDFKFLSIYNKYQHNPLQIEEMESGVYWNISISKALGLGLRVNEKIDERKHFIHASNAFIPEIQKLNIQYENWALTLFHNLASEEIINHLDLNTKWNSNVILLDRPEYKVLIDFLAFKTYIENEYAKISSLEPQVIYSFRSAAGKNLLEVSQLLEIDVLNLMNSNKWLNSGLIPADIPLLIYSPISKYHEYKKIDEANFAIHYDKDQLFPTLTINETLNKGKGGTFYSVNNLPGIQAELGDKFINLAFKADIHYTQFLKFNDMNPMDNIHIGKVYYLKSKRDKAPIPYHVAVPNETLWDISQMYAIKLNKLIEYNRLGGITKLQPGQLIWMQSKRPKNEPIQYLVKEKSLANIEPKEENKIVYSDKTTQYQNETIIAYQENTFSKKPEMPREPKNESQDLKINTLQETYKEPEQAPILYVAREKRTPIQKETVITPQEPKTSTQNTSSKEKKFTIHEVKPSDTLEKIAKLYDVETKQLIELNNLNNTKLEAGLKLIIKRNF